MEHNLAHATATGWDLGNDEHPVWPPLGPIDGVPDALAEILRREARRPRGGCERFLEDILFVRRIPAAEGPEGVR
ncbi:MAG TPA: hypothetical protein VFS92_03325, partial [Planctomycetota bacterium]|nr:hypothetical protein [Planctomycetota bacterium]